MAASSIAGAEATSPPPRTAAAPERRRRARPLLGTLVEVAVGGGSDAEIDRLAAIAFARIADFQRAMSFHEPGSDVRAIAAAAAGTVLTVSADTWAVIAAAQGFERDSGGVFNVAVAVPLVARGALPHPGEPAQPPLLATSALASLRLGPECTVTVVAPVWIDLGGIAKGAAVDAAIAALRLAGATSATVNAGGDLAVLGSVAEAVVVRGPGGIVVDAGLLAEGAIATSGPFAAGDRDDLVLAAGMRARWADRSISVVAPSCLVADALTKVVAVLGPAAAALLARHGAHGFSVDARGRVERVGPSVS